MQLADIERFWTRLQFGTGVRLRIYRKLSSLLSNGIQIKVALEMLHKQASKNGTRLKDPVAIILTEWLNAIKNGSRLNEAMGDWVPDQERMLIGAGESSGTLELSLMSVCDVVESATKMRSAVMSGVLYPTVLVAAAIGVLWLFGVKVIPQFSKVSNPDHWTGLARSMYVMSGLVQVWTIPVVTGLVVLITTLIVSLPHGTGAWRVYADRIPPWSIYRLWAGSGFIMSLSALIKAGVPVEKALVMLRSNGGHWLTERIDAAIYGLRSGLNLGQALERSGYGFPDPNVIDDVTIYASLSGFDRAMDLIGNEWLKKGVEVVQLQSKLLNMLSMLIMGGVTAWIAGGLFAIQQALTDSVQSMH